MKSIVTMDTNWNVDSIEQKMNELKWFFLNGLKPEHWT